MCYQNVCLGGVWLLATQKPISRPGWRKGKFALFQMLATGREGNSHLSKGQLPPLTSRQWELLQRKLGRGGLHAERAPSSLTVRFKLVISGLTSITLVVLGAVFQSWVHLFPILCDQFSELWQLKSWVQFGHHVPGDQLLQLVFWYYKAAYRIWLKMLSIAHEKELEVLEYT